MSARSDLEQLLRREYHPDYWSDDVVVRAGELLATLQPEDWEWLASAWPTWSVEHQRQLAGALLGAGPATWPILEDMLRSSDIDIASESATALLFDPAWPGNPALEHELQRVRDIMAPELVDIADDLLRRHQQRRPTP